MNYFFVAIIITVIGILLFIFKYIKGKTEQSFISIIFTAGLTMVSLSSENWQDTLVKIVAIINHRNDIDKIISFNKYYFFFGIFFMLIAIGLYFYSKRKVCVLNINGYVRKKIEPYLKNKKDFRNDFREREINFVSIYNNIFCNKFDNDSFECILEEIREQVNAFKNETIEGKKGYTGIAPIPFIMYAGSFLEREKIDDYYEFDKIDSKDYYRLSDKKNKKYPKLDLQLQDENIDVNQKELVLVISITKKITDEQIKQFKNKGNVARLEIENPKDNAIKNKKQLSEYVNTIFDTIESLGQKINNIERVHVICSSQSCLALEIGKRSVDITRIPEIVSYQFENQSEVKYPWGIVINGKNKGMLIKTLGEREQNV